jgi:hypothetical protein
MRTGLTAAVLTSLACAAPTRVALADESKPIRPPPFKDDVELASHPKTRHLSLGVSAVTLSIPANTRDDAGIPAGVAYAPTIGLEVDLAFPIFRYLEVGVTATGGMHALDYDRGARIVPSQNFAAGGSYESNALAQIWGELRLYPTLPVNRWVTLAAIVGAGFGRLEFPEATVDRGDHTFTIARRGASYWDFPLGVRATFTLVPRWLTLDLSFDVAPMIEQDGNAFVDVQALDAGSMRTIAPLPEIDATWVQGLGLSLIL